jgi:hypothetical protein
MTSVQNVRTLLESEVSHFAMWGFSPYGSRGLRCGKVYSITLSGEENRSGTYTQHFSLCRTLSLVTPVTYSPFIRGADFIQMSPRRLASAERLRKSGSCALVAVQNPHDPGNKKFVAPEGK